MLRRALLTTLLALLLAPAGAAAQTTNAVQFDGFLDYLDLNELDPGANFTFEAWVRFDALTLSQSVVSAAELVDSFNAFYLGYVESGWTVELDDDDAFENDDCGTPNTLCVTQALGAGSSHHLAVSVAGTLAELYIDGALVGVTTADTAPTFGLDTWILGAETDGGSYGSDSLNGVVDEVRIWSVARSAGQINCTKDWSLLGTEAGLYAAWPMDEIVFAGAATDVTGSGFDALLHGDAVFVESPFALTYSVGGDIGCFDGDSDGVTVDEGDCDDADPATYPGAPEVPYDGADNDCSGDGDVTDVDGDGFDGGDAGDDCDDEDEDVNPDAFETPYNGIDDDCDPGTPDDDLDGDGVGIASDCDDSDADRYPGNTEIPDDGVDQDCDGSDLTTGDDDDATDDDDTTDDDDDATDDDDVTDDDDFSLDDDDSATPERREGGCACDQETESTQAALPVALLLLGGLIPVRRRRD